MAAGLQAAMYIAVALLVSWKVTMAALIGGALTLSLLNGFVTMARRAGERQTDLLQEVSARLVDSVAGLPFLRFTTPGEYLRGHEPVGTLTIRQDTADGSFDGYASWTEKWTNQALWTGIERSRLAELHALRLLEEPAEAGPTATAEAQALLGR